MVLCRSADAMSLASWPNTVHRYSSTTNSTSSTHAPKRCMPSVKVLHTHPRRFCARQWRGSPTRQGCTSMWQPAANSSWRLRPMCQRIGSCSMATTSHSKSCRWQWTRALEESSSIRLTRSIASSNSSHKGMTFRTFLSESTLVSKPTRMRISKRGLLIRSSDSLSLAVLRRLRLSVSRNQNR